MNQAIRKKRISSFVYLNITQFLGALNDNIYKLLIAYLFIQIEGIAESYKILALSGAVFVLPFLLFSASSGVLADRFSKRNIIILTKVLELIIMSCGILAFYAQSKLGSFGILFLLATQSAIFGPSKYGIIPEIVEEEKISRANGMMTLFTFLAIILGTFLASFILDITGRNFILAAFMCFIFSLIGLFTSFRIEYTPPSGSSQRFNILFFYEIYKTLKSSYAVPSLLAAIFGSSFFLFMGAYIQLNIIPFAVESLSLTDIQGGYLFLVTALGIGTGALIAGKISGKSVELGMVPLATAGITFCLFLITGHASKLHVVVPFIFLLGTLGGIYQVPLDSYIQIASSKEARGQVIAATNFLSFLGVLAASFLLYFFSDRLGYSARKGFVIMGYLTALLTVLFSFQFFDYLTRFISMVLSRIRFKIIAKGEENIPNVPAIYVCRHTAWNDTLLMCGTQRRRLRFFIEEEQEHSKIFRLLYGALRIIFIPTIEPLEESRYCLKTIEKALKKGFSVCIFVENRDIAEEIGKLKSSEEFGRILAETGTPIVPVKIQKGSKNKEARLFKRFMEKLFIPAKVTFSPSE